MPTQQIFTRIGFALSALFTLCLFVSCDKDDKDPVAETPIYFSGILLRDANGLPLNSDTTDWHTNAVWVEKESALFLPSSVPDCTQYAERLIAAYPNPCDAFFAFRIEKEPSTRVELRIVDQDFTVLMTNDSIFQTEIYVNAEALGIQDTVRLYYRFVENNCTYHGHGDVLILQ